MRTIAVINQKGGVGKTTTVANLGAAVARAGRRVCLLDLDPQAHLTLHFGIEPGTPEFGTYEMFTADAPLDSTVQSLGEGLDLVPSVIDLAAAEIELVSTVGREQILRDRIEDSQHTWDYGLIDCPPSLGLLTLNALSAADDVIIPLQPHFLALQGLGKLLETVSLVRRRINPNLRVSGILLCMYESGTRLAGEVLADLTGFFQAAHGEPVPWSDAHIFQTVIRRNVKLAECPSHGQTIFDYEPASNGATDYGALAAEFIALYEPAPASETHQAAEPSSSLTQTETRPDQSAPGPDVHQAPAPSCDEAPSSSDGEYTADCDAPQAPVAPSDPPQP